MTPTTPPGLTSAAEAILRNPTFLPDAVAETGGGGGGGGEASGLLAVVEGSGGGGGGLLPVLGSVLSFGVGTVIGSEICHVIGIEGCWYFGSEGADPSTIGGGHWMVYEPGSVAPSGTKEAWPIPVGYTYSWFWDREHSESDYQGYGAGCEGGLPPNPTGATSNVNGYAGVCRKELGPPEVNMEIEYNVPFRSSMANREFGYHATDSPEISNYEPGGKPYEAPSNWPEKVAGNLKGQSGNPAGHLGEKLASEIKGSEVADPYLSEVTLPDCRGLLWEPCEELVEELELVPDVEFLTWSDADLGKAPEEVKELVPNWPKTVEEGSTVHIVANPDTGGMPAVIPTPEKGETYAHYASRLNPALNGVRQYVDPSAADATEGPNVALRTSPAPGTRTDPSLSTDVTVFTNPADMPAVGAGWEPPAVGSINLKPLEVVTPCNVFPFGAVCWFVSALGELGSAGSCPTWGLKLHGAVPGMSGRTSNFNVCRMQPVVEGVRPWVYWVGTVFMFLTFAAWARGGGNLSESDQSMNDAMDKAD